MLTCLHKLTGLIAISTLTFMAIRTVQNATNGELQHQHIILQRDSERIKDHQGSDI